MGQRSWEEWTPGEDALLRANAHRGLEELVKHVPHTKGAIKMRMSRLGLLGSPRQRYYSCAVCGLTSNESQKGGVGRVNVPRLADHHLIQIRETHGADGFPKIGGVTVRQALQTGEYHAMAEKYLRDLVRLGREAEALLTR